MPIQPQSPRPPGIVLPSEEEDPYVEMWHEYRQDDRTLQDVLNDLVLSGEEAVGNDIVRDPSV